MAGPGAGDGPVGPGAGVGAGGGWLRPLLEGFLARHRPPAVAAAVLDREGLVAADHIGVRVRGRAEQVDAGDRWHLGSCTKAVTAMLYARLVERGDAEWGTPVADLFPDLTLHPGWRAVTVDDLFTGRAGLPRDLTRAAHAAARRDPRPPAGQRTAATAEALAEAPADPGRPHYSNLGYVVAGAAIDRLAGAAFEEALHRYVLGPLGVGSAGFGAPPGVWGHAGARLGVGRVDLWRGPPVDPAAPHADNPALMNPAGGLHMSVADWAVVQRVFLAQGGGLLGPRSVDRLLTPAAGAGPRQACGWVPAGHLGEASLAQQGSNTLWVATAVMDRDRIRTALVVCNDGRRRLLGATVGLAMRMLATG